jgi:phosphoglycolate phosphatase
MRIRRIIGLRVDFENGWLVNRKLFLFDIDGTLVWTRGAGREATRHAMIEVFGTCAALDTHNFGGKTDWQTLTELLGMTEAELQPHMSVYSEVMGRHMARVIGDFQVAPCPGGLELIGALRARDDVVLGIVTGNVPHAAPVKLSAAGYDPAHFVVAAYGSERMLRDHLPALAVERAEHLTGHHFAPRDVWVIGDTAADVSCARAINAVMVGVKTGYGDSPQEIAAAQPDYLLNDLTEFWDVVRL